jgi:hypothetical protein
LPEHKKSYRDYKTSKKSKVEDNIPVPQTIHSDDGKMNITFVGVLNNYICFTLFTEKGKPEGEVFGFSMGDYDSYKKDGGQVSGVYIFRPTS